MGWIITGAVFLFLFWLLSRNLKVFISYDEPGVTVRVSFLGFTVFRMPEKERKKPKREKKPKKKKPSKQPEQKKKPDIAYILRHIPMLLEVLQKALGTFYRKLLKKIVFHKFFLVLQIGKENAYDTAMAFGRTSSFFYPVLAMLDELFDLREKEVYLSPDFQSGQSLFRFSSAFSIRIYHFLLLAGKLIIIFFQNKQLFEKLFKGGVSNERTSSPGTDGHGDGQPQKDD